MDVLLPWTTSRIMTQWVRHQRPFERCLLTCIDIAHKYRLYKRLCKMPHTAPGKKDELPRPMTPPGSTRPKDPQSVFLSKRPVEPTAPLAAFNPFSPQKKKKGKEKEQFPIYGDPCRNLFGTFASSSSSENRSLSTNPFPPIQASSSTPPSRIPLTPAPTTPVSRARKRLRGEPVSPSPNKDKRRRLLSQNTNPFPRMKPDARDSDNDIEVVDADSSFVDNSPVKASNTCKLFPKLFTESSLPPNDLFVIKSNAQVGRSHKTLPLQSKHPAHMLNTRKRSRSGSPELNSAQCVVIGKASSEARSKNAINQSTNSYSDYDAVADPPILERPKSPLIPPSPPLTGASATTFNRLQKHPTKGYVAFKGRKKVKLDDQSTSDSDGPDLSPKLKILNHRTARPRPEGEADGWDSDPILGRTRFKEPRAASPDTAGGHVEVNLPNELQRVLALESVALQAKIPNEDNLLKDLLYGRRTNHYYPNKGGEIWDVGEDHLTSIEGGTTRNINEEEDWEGEPVPWEIAEL